MNKHKIQQYALELVADIEMNSPDNIIEAKVADIVGELKRCSKCKRPLVLLHHCDYYPNDVCGHCQG